MGALSSPRIAAACAVSVSDGAFRACVRGAAMTRVIPCTPTCSPLRRSTTRTSMYARPHTWPSCAAPSSCLTLLCAGCRWHDEAAGADRRPSGRRVFCQRKQRGCHLPPPPARQHHVCEWPQLAGGGPYWVYVSRGGGGLCIRVKCPDTQCGVRIGVLQLFTSAPTASTAARTCPSSSRCTRTSP